MLDQELAGTNLREFYPISLNLFFIRFALKLTSQQAAVCNIGDDADRVLVAHWKKRVCSSRYFVSTLYCSHSLSLSTSCV